MFQKRSVLAATLAFTITACSAEHASQTGTVFKSDYFTVTQTGQGPHVILVPGLASNAAVWDSTVGALKDSYTLHTVQVSGFGGAPARGNAANQNVLDDISADLAAYSAQLDAPAQMVGHSLGGLVTMKAALRDDSALDAIVIVDVLPFFSVLMDENASAESIAPVAGMMKATLIAQSDEVFESSQNKALKALVKSETHRALALSWSVASDRRVMAQAMSEVLVTDLREDVSNLDVPVTVIYARDPMIPNMDGVEAFYQKLYASVPDVTLEAVDGALHFIMMDEAEAFHALLEASLSNSAE